jgi:hypothetical protein
VSEEERLSSEANAKETWDPSKDTRDPVTVLKLIHQQSQRKALVYCTPHREAAEVLYAALDPAQAGSLAAHALDLLRAGDRATAEVIARGLVGITKADIDPSLQGLVLDYRTALDAARTMRFREAICDSCGAYFHVKVGDVRAETHLDSIVLDFVTDRIYSPGLLWGRHRPWDRTEQMTLLWSGHPRVGPWHLGFWYGPDGATFYFHDALVKAAVALAGTFADEETPEKAFNSLAYLFHQCGLAPDTHQDHLHEYLDPSKLPALAASHAELGRACRHYSSQTITVFSAWGKYRPDDAPPATSR